MKESDSERNNINTSSNQNILASSMNPPLITEKQTEEASIENINDTTQKGNSVNKDGYIGKKVQ